MRSVYIDPSEVEDRFLAMARQNIAHVFAGKSDATSLASKQCAEDLLPMLAAFHVAVAGWQNKDMNAEVAAFQAGLSLGICARTLLGSMTDAAPMKAYLQAGFNEAYSDISGEMMHSTVEPVRGGLS